MNIFKNTVTLRGFLGKDAEVPTSNHIQPDSYAVLTHVLRVSRRLGLITASTICDAAHTSLESVVPPRYRYDFHVNAISHGRTVCLAKVPRCERCVLNRICPYPKTLSRPRL